MATLATLPDGDSLSFSRLQQVLDLTAGNLITHLRKLEDAGYLASSKSRADPAAGPARTAVHLTLAGRTALQEYSTILRGLLDTASPSRPDGPS